ANALRDPARHTWHGGQQRGGQRRALFVPPRRSERADGGRQRPLPQGHRQPGDAARLGYPRGRRSDKRRPVLTERRSIAVPRWIPRISPGTSSGAVRFWPRLDFTKTEVDRSSPAASVFTGGLT